MYHWNFLNYFKILVNTKKILTMSLSSLSEIVSSLVYNPHSCQMHKFVTFQMYYTRVMWQKYRLARITIGR